jgi:hypothetical protein
MGPFASNIVTQEIRIRRGKWTSLVAEAAEPGASERPIGLNVKILLAIVLGVAAAVLIFCSRRRTSS